MDEDGNLPLQHIAVTAASYLATAHHAAQDHPTMAEVAAAAAAASDNADDLSVISDAVVNSLPYKVRNNLISNFFGSFAVIISVAKRSTITHGSEI